MGTTVCPYEGLCHGMILIFVLTNPCESTAALYAQGLQQHQQKP